MNKKSSLILLVLGILTEPLFGQAGALDTRKELGEFMIKIQNARILNPDDYKKEFEGSPFLSDEWAKGIIFLQNDKSLEATILYDIYSQQMLVKKGEEILTLAQPHSIKKIVLGKQIFIWQAYKTGDKIEESYFELLVDGKFQLFKKYNCNIVRADRQISAYEGKPKDRFRVSKEYYLKVEKEKAIVFPSDRDDFFALFPSQKDTLIEYCRQNKLKLKKEEDLIKIFFYLNSK